MDRPSGRRRVPEPLVVCRRGRLPILPVERADLDRGEVDTVDATDIEGPAARGEAGADGRGEHAMLAEIMLRRVRIELIQGEIGRAREDAKVRLRRRVPERAL